LFRIPDYQRGYAWTSKHVKDFWSDVVQLEDKMNHYVGVLTLEVAPPESHQKWVDDQWIIESKDFVPYYVVDGQQRLTTIVILLQVITERLLDDEKLNFDSKNEIRKQYIFQSKDDGISRSYIFGYEKDNPSYEFLKTRIFLEKSDEHSANEETIYTRNLLNAKNFFSDKISKFSKDELGKFFKKVTQNFVFNIYSISTDIDVCVAFETMNNRGKPLSHLELLKNRLIFLSTKFDIEPREKAKLRGIINECWKTLYHYLGRNQNRPIDDNEFLAAHFNLYFSTKLQAGSKEKVSMYPYWLSSRNDAYKNILLDDIFSAKRLINHHDVLGPLTVNAIYDYAHDIKAAVRLYYELLNPVECKFSDDEKIWLARISRYDILPATQPLLISIYRSKAKEAARIELLQELDRYLFFSSPRRGQYDVSLEQLTFFILKMEMTASDGFDKLKRSNDEFFKSLDFFEAILTLGKIMSGYYSWRTTRYFLYEYEQSLHTASKTDRQRLSWEEFSAENYHTDFKSIEHIYPQQAKHIYWKEMFSEYTVKEKNTLRNSLGNLLPLSQPKNSSLGNKSFPEKKGSDSNPVGYAFGCYSEIEVSQLSDWGPIQILERGVRLLEFMERRWGIDLGTVGDKVNLLNLDFVLVREKLPLPVAAKVVRSRRRAD
jgi:uncharacterized protein with ParB-like and HNH nuclease domain